MCGVKVRHRLSETVQPALSLSLKGNDVRKKTRSYFALLSLGSSPSEEEDGDGEGPD